MTEGSTAPYRRRRGWLRRWIGDPLATLFGGRLPGPSAVLRVARNDGTWRQVPIIVWRRGSTDHVVALFGITPWVTAVRRGAAVQIRHAGRLEQIRLEELDPAATAEFLKWFRGANPVQARMYLDVDGTSVADGTGTLAERHPVFRIVRRQG